MQKLNDPSEADKLGASAEKPQNPQKSHSSNRYKRVERTFRIPLCWRKWTEFLRKSIKELAETPFDASSVLEKAYWHISVKAR